jgi:hypothetical protein
MVAPPKAGGGTTPKTPAACPSPPVPGPPIPAPPKAGAGLPPKPNWGVGAPGKPAETPAAPTPLDEGSIAGPLAPKLKGLAAEGACDAAAGPLPAPSAVYPKGAPDGALPAPNEGVLDPKGGIEGLELAAPMVNPPMPPPPKPVCGAPKAGPLPVRPGFWDVRPKGVLTPPLAKKSGAGPAVED